MVVFSATGQDGTQLLTIALSYANLDRLRKDGLEGFIKIKGKDHDLRFDIIITAGPTEPEIQEAIKSLIGPDTKVKIDPKLRN